MEKTESFLKEIGATPIRSKKHRVWRLPNGKNFVIPNSASDCRADANALHDLKNILYGTKVFKEGVRREKKVKAKPMESSFSGFNNIRVAESAAKEINIFEQIAADYKAKNQLLETELLQVKEELSQNISNSAAEKLALEIEIEKLSKELQKSYDYIDNFKNKRIIKFLIKFKII